jgi:peptide/nickel transport system substrate-binding protein
VAAAAILFAAGCTSTPTDEATTDAPPVADCPQSSERMVVLVHDRRPEDLHPFREGDVIRQWIGQGIFEGLWGIDANHEFIPELLAEEPELEQHSDDSVTVRFRLRNGLTWSDGTPLTPEHVADTWRLIMERQGGERGDFVLDFGARTGYELIHPDSWKVDGQSGSFLLTEPFGGFRNLFTIVLPTHVLESAAAANLALASGRVGIDPLPASGPLQLLSFGRSGPLDLGRNEQYHGSVLPGVGNPGAACISGARVAFRNPDAPEAMAEDLTDGPADLLVAQPRRALAELLVARTDLTISSVPSLAVEHWGFNLHNPHLADPLVREAIASAIDKQAVVDGVWRPVHGETAAGPLGNFFHVPSQAAYEDHQPNVGAGQGATARGLLEQAGYSIVDDGWEHPDRGRLVLEVGTTPDRIRQAQFSILQTALAEAGIEVTLTEEDGWLDDVLFSEPSLACSEAGPGVDVDVDGDGEAVTAACGLWDIAQFTWTFPSPWPGGQAAQFTSRSPRNPYGVADEDVDRLAAACLDEMDLAGTADCFNRLDRLVLGADADLGVVIVPLTQRATFVAHRNDRIATLPAFSDAPGAGPLAVASGIIALGGGPAEEEGTPS